MSDFSDQPNQDPAVRDHARQGLLKSVAKTFGPTVSAIFLNPDDQTIPKPLCFIPGSEPDGWDRMFSEVLAVRCGVASNGLCAVIFEDAAAKASGCRPARAKRRAVTERVISLPKVAAFDISA